jgi:hypothetical protein
MSRSCPQVGEVREDEVDAEMLVARKGEACVDDHDPAVDSTTIMFFPTSPSPRAGSVAWPGTIAQV